VTTASCMGLRRRWAPYPGAFGMLVPRAPPGPAPLTDMLEVFLADRGLSASARPAGDWKGKFRHSRETDWIRSSSGLCANPTVWSLR
jgi:hypothetical protein